MSWPLSDFTVSFQRKNESCQKCCQFWFYEVWQRTFYFLHILWDLKIGLGIPPDPPLLYSEHHNINYNYFKRPFSSKGFSPILCSFVNPVILIQMEWRYQHPRCTNDSIKTCLIKEVFQGHMVAMRQSRELKPKLSDSLLNCFPDRFMWNTMGGLEEYDLWLFFKNKCPSSTDGLIKV